MGFLDRWERKIREVYKEIDPIISFMLSNNLSDYGIFTSKCVFGEYDKVHFKQVGSVRNFTLLVNYFDFSKVFIIMDMGDSLDECTFFDDVQDAIRCGLEKSFGKIF